MAVTEGTSTESTQGVAPPRLRSVLSTHVEEFYRSRKESIMLYDLSALVPFVVVFAVLAARGLARLGRRARPVRGPPPPHPGGAPPEHPDVLPPPGPRALIRNPRLWQSRGVRHRYECPMRWADLDQLGHVNNVVYVDYLQEARVDMLRAHGRGPEALAEGLVVVRHEVTYLKPLTFDFRPVSIECWVTDIKAATFTMAYEIFHETPEGTAASTSGRPPCSRRTSSSRSDPAASPRGAGRPRGAPRARPAAPPPHAAAAPSRSPATTRSTSGSPTSTSTGTSTTSSTSSTSRSRGSR